MIAKLLYHCMLLFSLTLLGVSTPRREALAQSPDDADKIATELNTQTGISFTLNTKNGEIDAFDFKVSEGAKKVVFKLRRGVGAFPQEIFIGKSGSHPTSATFTLPAHPRK